MHGKNPSSVRRHFSPLLRLAAVMLLSSLILSACGGNREPFQAPDMQMTAEEMYEVAWRRLQGGNYDGAMQMLRRLESRYPFTPEGQQAQLDQIYATYLSRDRQGTAEAADRYIRENPRSDHLDYAYYMKGMGWFDPKGSVMRRWLGMDPARLDIRNAERSFEAFRELVERYPDSRYSEDARLRMIYLRNTIARHNWHVANYYLERGAYMAAVARASKVVEEMQPNEVTPYALDVLTRAYEAIGEEALADDTRNVLARNFPEHESGATPPNR